MTTSWVSVCYAELKLLAQLVSKQIEPAVIDGEHQQGSQCASGFSVEMRAVEEGGNHEDERHDVGQQACAKSLADGTLQRDAVADVQGRVVSPDLDELLFALAAAAELSCAATATCRSLQDAHGHFARTDAFHDAVVLYGLYTTHYTFKFMQRYKIFCALYLFIKKEFDKMHKKSLYGLF